MSEMIERIAQAMEQAALAASSEKSQFARQITEKMARAAIEAMREPTKEMIEEGAGAEPNYDGVDAKGIYQAMIDEALK